MRLNNNENMRQKRATPINIKLILSSLAEETQVSQVAWTECADTSAPTHDEKPG